MEALYEALGEALVLSIIGVPLLMATQHPDSASRGFTVEEEVEEAVRDLLPRREGGFGCGEKMIDYEGKLTPYHQPRWILERLSEYGLIPGSDYLLTLRIPAEKLEDPERQVMSMWSAITANTVSLRMGGQAVKYIVNPMSGSGYELYVAQRRMLKLQRFASEEIGVRMEDIRVIPLVEDVPRLIHIDKLMEGLRLNLLKESGIHYEHYRVMLGKSDAAMMYGHLSSLIALKLALSRLWRWGEETGIRIYPIIGVGSLPFRGHLRPEAVREFAEQYKGFFTVTVQSGIRYDQGVDAVEKIASYLERRVGEEPLVLDVDEEKMLIQAARLASAEYLDFLLRAYSKIEGLSAIVPKRRARLEREAYPRDISASLAFAACRKVIDAAPRAPLLLPRAIGFTAIMYSIGVPPGLVGLGRGLEAVERSLGTEVVEEIISRYLPILREDLGFELEFYAPDIAKNYLGEKLSGFIERDVEVASRYLGITREPGEIGNRHREVLEAIRKAIGLGRLEDARRLVAEAGRIRGSLG